MMPLSLANLILIGTKLEHFPFGKLQSKQLGLQIMADLKTFKKDPTYHSSGVFNDLENDANFLMSNDLKAYFKNSGYIKRIGKEIKADAQLLKDMK